jgi:hypothetical protein
MAKLPYSTPALSAQLTAETFGQFQTAVVQAFQRIASVWNNPDFGATASRPGAQLTVGQVFFDTTLGFPVWWNGTTWVDATGTPS